MSIVTSLRPLLRKQSDESESENGENKAIKSNDDCCHLAAPIIEKTARKMFQAVKRPRSWNGLRSAMYACTKKCLRTCLNKKVYIDTCMHKKCMPAQKNVYTHVCAKEMYACAQNNVYAHACTEKMYTHMPAQEVYMYAQKKGMPAQKV